MIMMIIGDYDKGNNGGDGDDDSYNVDDNESDLYFF